eukprot:CAMPEP_0204326302 /NCGR_PEP_ID=MMETSP0469-20131031/11717_1 /ASSEMBLY_ACC=CAM_ASM_000384 /TAXON_ID=2969 /ORGANISM="Oxyrrhis marina" /LENGTH=175 /DNA_ID=CAMNT_0051308325 /DNA_START=12 /DNA_END=539 /DNA_ORIENTATION=-
MCELYGYFDANKVPGNFHVATHGVSRDSWEMVFGRNRSRLDMRHTINHLAFVDTDTNETVPKSSSLDGFVSPGSFTFQYYLTVTPATFVSNVMGYSGHHGYQMRGSSYVTNELVGPAVFFRFDIDPIRVTYSRSRPAITRFIVEVSAIVGGCISFMTLINRFGEAIASLLLGTMK